MLQRLSGMASRHHSLIGLTLLCLLFAPLLTSCGGASTASNASGDIHKIKHIIVIMQENRSFDSYFGTYPGVDGIPSQNGVPTVCVNDPQTGQCVKPFHNPNDLNGGGPHGAPNATADIDGGPMPIASATRYMNATTKFRYPMSETVKKRE